MYEINIHYSINIHTQITKKIVIYIQSMKNAFRHSNNQDINFSSLRMNKT